MPRFEFTLTLEKQARKSGADKYEASSGQKDGTPLVTIIQPYVPQLVSRPDGVTPIKQMKLILEY